ncbi:MAG: histidine triad nucleotide-binding protein [Pseudomonadales bacterium]|nr:histidine triad nucleotide-binding protein [Pseudomonadales bacterium]
MNKDCLFCKIISGDIPGDITYEDELVVAFRDINPQADLHQLIVPREHISTTNDLTSSHQMLIGHMVLTAQKIARDNNVAEDGYRLIFNCNQHGGQTVYHIHLHILAGRQLTQLG